MKRNHRHRPLVYEQLDSRAAPSSLLIVVPAGETNTGLAAATTSSIVTYSSQASCDQYETEQILRFVAEHTIGGARAHRPATLPTAAQCAAADEMMKLVPAAWNSFLVLGFYNDGAEL